MPLSLLSHIQNTLLASLLLGFTIIILPRSTPVTLLPPVSSSLDKPQYQWMRPITGDTRFTMFWWYLGSLLVVGWRAGWLRNAEISQDSTKEENWDRVRNKQEELLLSATQTIVSAIPFSVLILLLGAPMASHLTQTLLFGGLVGVLTLFSPLYTIGAPLSLSRNKLLFGSDPATVARWVGIFAEFSPQTNVEKALFYPSFGAVFGGWIGSLPIALDWDRPWQAWPLTSAFGSILGFALGCWVACLLQVWQEIQNAASSEAAQAKGEKKSKAKSRTKLKVS